LVDIIATPYVPGLAQGSISHNPKHDGAILVVSGSALPKGSRPAGLVVVEGAIFSHPMLGCLAMGIPTVIVTAEQAECLSDGQKVQLDGYAGSVRSLSAGVTTAPQRPTAPQPGQPVMSADGVPVALRASVRNATGANRAKEVGAESIGLVRTEFLEPDAGKTPDRSFYRQAFGELMTAADPLGVTLRLIDIAADKLPTWLLGTGHELGSFGRQGVRLFQDEPLHTVVSAQLDALVEGGATNRVKLLVPYITTSEELQQTRDWIYRRVEVPIGTMIENPAAALDIAAQLEIADFAALGTNDLMQCLFAADRDDPALQRYLDPYSPSLYRFLARVASDAGDKLPLVQVCGLLSQLPGVLPLMLGLGFRAFSVDAAYIPFLAATVRETNIGEAGALAEQACRVKTSSALRALPSADQRLTPLPGIHR
jgi:phosphoenolpyruvate-protein kinase (PTS system EI component)